MDVNIDQIENSTWEDVLQQRMFTLKDGETNMDLPETGTHLLEYTLF